MSSKTILECQKIHLNLLEIIGENLTRKMKGCPTIPSHQQLMIALWKMATMDSYRSICDRFNVGRATAVRAVRRVTRALCSKSSIFIQWPSGDRAITTMRDFETASGFPGIIGAINGTHIRINAPKENSADYVNCKGYHSIHLQVGEYNIESQSRYILNVDIQLCVHLFVVSMQSPEFNRIVIRDILVLFTINEFSDTRKWQII